MFTTEITLHADASWHQTSRIAGWGAILDDGREPLHRSGLGPFYLLNSTHAELYAVVAGIDCAVAAFPGLQRVRVKTDSDNVVMILNGDRTRPLDDIMQHLLYRIRVENLVIDAQWVRGHQDTSASADAAANNRCDGMARKQLACGLTMRGVPRDEPIVIPEPVITSPLDAHRHAVRIAMVARFGSRAGDLGKARRWAGDVLGRGRVRISWLDAGELDCILAALQEPIHAAPRADWIAA
jgi:ribonuclease HI